MLGKAGKHTGPRLGKAWNTTVHDHREMQDRNDVLNLLQPPNWGCSLPVCLPWHAYVLFPAP